MLGTDFPYADWYPEGKVVVQIDERGEHIGRRTPVDVGVVGDAGLALARAARRASRPSPTARTSTTRAERYARLARRAARAHRPATSTTSGLVNQVRAQLRQPRRADPPGGARRRDRPRTPPPTRSSPPTPACPRSGSRASSSCSGTRRLVGSYNLGSMANAMPQALGAQALDRGRQVIAFCGDGGLTMLLGDLITAVAHELPVKLVVFDNGRLGMVKLEQEQGGLPEFGTVLDEPRPRRGRARDRPARACASRTRTARRRRARRARPPRPGAARRAHQPRRDLAAAEGQARPRAGASRSRR